MESRNVDFFIMCNSRYFETYQLSLIRERLLALDESKWKFIQLMHFKDPILMLVVSILIGTLGIDRFIIGDIGLGLGKLLTCGGLGIWYLVDLFLIMRATREKNIQELEQFL